MGELRRILGLDSILSNSRNPIRQSTTEGFEQKGTKETKKGGDIERTAIALLCYLLFLLFNSSASFHHRQVIPVNDLLVRTNPQDLCNLRRLQTHDAGHVFGRVVRQAAGDDRSSLIT